MQCAMVLAEQAARSGEVPVGAVLVKNDEIIAEGWNASIQLHDASAHAEIIAIREASLRQKNYRLPETTLYVTLEPCSMCAGALIHARIKRLVFAAYDTKAGAVCSRYRLLDSNKNQHQPQWLGGVLESQCAKMLTDFFVERRAARSKKTKNKENSPRSN